MAIHIGNMSNEDNSVPDMMRLNLYCSRARAPRDDSEESLLEAELSWEPVKEWLSSHGPEQVRAAAEQRGEGGLTALHFACRHVPPPDVIDVFLSIAADTVQWPDDFGWLPIHLACASGADDQVIQSLAEAFPESKTMVDRRGRTPLHFALGENPASPNIIFLLASSGAAGYKDEIGMLPLHYACAYGASEEVLYVLTDAFPDAISDRNQRDRTPLHVALSNAGRKTVPAAVRLLLSLNRDIVNSIDGGPLPLRVLAEYASTIESGDHDDDADPQAKKDSVRSCLAHLLHAENDPTPDFFTALQSLPDWLSEQAVVMPVVQVLLNEKISQRFPTAVLMMDFFFLILVICFYYVNVNRTLLQEPDNGIQVVWLVPLYIGASYFTLRAVFQVISLLSLKSFNIWLCNPVNYINTLFVILVLVWTVEMQRGPAVAQNNVFRYGASISVIFLWVKLLAYLRNMLIDFAVFVRGVFYVLRRLAAFLTALFIILIAFAQMFHTVYQQTKSCQGNCPNPGDYPFPYCDWWSSFLSVYTMLLGEVGETDFQGSGIAIALYVAFMFLVVILLANVLIAIVTDSYKVIQDQQAAVVFWTNRLDFVAEMDAIANGPWKRKYFGACMTSASSSRDDGGSSSNNNRRQFKQEAGFGQKLWKQLLYLFQDDVDDSVFSFEFWALMVVRLIAGLFIIPFWLLLGLMTFGLLWPPQVRKYIFTSKILKHSSDLEVEDELRRTQVEKLKQEVKDLKDELLQELALQRTQVVQMKSIVAERKLAISNEMTDIKRIVSILFERQAIVD